MKPRYPATQTDDLAVVQRDLERTFDQFGELTVSTDLGVQSIGTTETAIAHGLGAPPKRWVAGNLTADARVWQTKPADRAFLYLIASAPVTAAITVW